MDLQGLVGASRLDESSGLPLDAPFTRAVARAEGVPRHQLTWLCRQGLLRQPIHGVYVVTQLPDSTMLRAQSLSLAVPEDSVICDRHAGWLLGAEMVLAPNEHLALRPIRIFRPSGHGRLRNGLADSGERNLRPDDITEVLGLPVTTPLRTSWDLGRVRWPEPALCGLDAMLRLGAFSQDELLEGVERFRGMRWVTTLRSIAPIADGRSESPGESVLRLRCLENGLGGMVPQVHVMRWGQVIARLDLADERLMLAVEYDGIEWHTSPEQRTHDARRRRAAEDEGWVVKAFGKEAVFGRDRICDRLLREAAREAAHRRRVVATAEQ